MAPATCMGVVLSVWAEEENIEPDIENLDRIPEVIHRVLYRNRVKNWLVAAYQKQGPSAPLMQLKLIQEQMRGKVWTDMQGWLRNIAVDSENMEQTMRQQAEKWTGRMVRERPIPQTARQDRQTIAKKPVRYMAHRSDGPASLLRMFGHVHRAMCSGGCQVEVLEEYVGARSGVGGTSESVGGASERVGGCLRLPEPVYEQSRGVF